MKKTKGMKFVEVTPIITAMKNMAYVAPTNT